MILEEPDWLGSREFSKLFELFSLKITLSFDVNFSKSKEFDTSESVRAVKDVGDARGISDV